MKSQYNILCDYLPFKASNKNPLNPILYLYDGQKMLAAYSFDKIKKVIYVSDYDQVNYTYMSMYQFNCEGWEIIDKEFHNELIEALEHSKELPF